MVDMHERDRVGVISASLLFLLLADAALETFWSGSPVRWWVVGAVVVSVVGNALVWKRATWSTASSTSLFVLMAIVAVTAWLPGGLTNGVRLLGRSTATVLSLTCSAGVALATFVLVRQPRIPRQARWIVVALGTYGVGAFLQGAVTGTPFPSLLAGQSLWRGLPYVLQGAVVGGLVLLPVALVVSAVRAGLRAPAPRSTARAMRQAAALATSLALVVAALLPRDAPAGPPSTIVATTQPPTPTNVAAAAARSEPEATASFGARDSTEVWADPDFDLDLTKYAAALTRLKESLDRALIDVDAARARLGGQPETITAFVRDRIHYEPYVGALRGARGTLLARGGNAVDRALLLSALLNSAGHRTRFASGQLSLIQAETMMRMAYKPTPLLQRPPDALVEIDERSAALFATLVTALDDAGFKVRPADESARQQAVREAQQHVWVQLATQAGWVELDPSPGVQYGRSLTTPVRVSDEVDPMLFHTVEFGVEAEVQRNGTRETQRVLYHKSLAADLQGESIGLFHERQATGATPVMVVGKRVISGSLIHAPAQQEFSRNLGARVFESILGKPIAPPFVSGEWLTIRIAGPSGQRDVRYTIFDAIGPAARRSGRLAVDAGIATQAANALNDSIGLAVANGSLPSTILIALLADLDEPDSPQGAIRLLTMQGVAYFVTRSLLRTRYVDALPLSYIDRPSVIITRLATDEERNSDRLTMDLTLKAYRTLRAPDDPLAAEGVFYDYLADGVIDHSVERWIGGGDPDTSVGALFETAAGHDGVIRVATDVSDSSLASLTADGRLLVSDAIAQGRLPILVQRRPSGWTTPLGWWTVDPRTGWTEDTNEFGNHQGERAVTQNVSTTVARDQGRKLGQHVAATVRKQVCTLGVAAAVTIVALALATSMHVHPDAIGSETSIQDTYEIVDLLCGRVGRKTPRIPPPGRAPPVTGPLLRKMPKPAPPADKFYRLKGGKRAWR
jgi:transglutaminase-like putative cysteine protease